MILHFMAEPFDGKHFEYIWERGFSLSPSTIWKKKRESSF